ncbi:hypothetical protein HAX54_016558 [Datura stramonium]|uniref:Uncharacterized protein n=1 Tax=Datura stramonium TaxID=4076 RepID=A0ABS8UKQ1_DATST|nr:hypothetical protein [Datura stramonium]
MINNIKEIKTETDSYESVTTHHSYGLEVDDGIGKKCAGSTIAVVLMEMEEDGSDFAFGSGGLRLPASLVGEKKEAAAGASRGRAKRSVRGTTRWFRDLCMSREKRETEEKEIR